MADDNKWEYASPPCFMHELDPNCRTEAWADVSRWRKAERERLIEQRIAIGPAEWAARSHRIAAKLNVVIGEIGSRVVSIYWPFRGEPDLRVWAANILERGGQIALPVVVRKAFPLEFRPWKPGDPLERGVWNILVPVTSESVQPDIVIAPLVGFDGANFRLGYGGGYFDRTLAVMSRKPLVVGIGYQESQVPTIYPQPHDVPMDVVVVE